MSEIDAKEIRAAQNDVIAALRKQERLIKAGQLRLAKDGGTYRDIKNLTDAVGTLGRSLAVVLSEVRRQEEAVEKAAKRLDNDARVALVLDFVAELPIEHRERIRARLDELEAGL